MAELTEEQITALQDENISLKAENEKLTTANVDLKEQVQVAETLNAELQEKLAKAQNKASEPGNTLPTVKIGKKKYQFTTPTITHNKVVMTADEIKDNKELLEHLVDIQAGCLQEVED